MNRIKVTLISLLVMVPALCKAQQYDADWKSIDSRPVPEWFEDAKFGIFIHWGLYSVPSFSPSAADGVAVYERYAEHYWHRLESKRPAFVDFQNSVYGEDARYQDFVGQFKAEMFQPEEWARIFEEAGAKYVVLTSKHHEGFCLWPSQYSWNWNAGDVGPHRDLLGDLTTAVRAKGLRMGYYYSLLEWYNPAFKKETLDSYIDTHMFPQMKELVQKYSPDLVWTDGEWDYTSDEWRSVEFLQWLFNESCVKESVAVNDRWGKETRGVHGGFYTTEYDLHPGSDLSKHPWEECRGISGSFGFNRREYLEDYSTSEELVHILVNKVARGGNLLLNVGPTADGRIPVIMQQRLKDMGDWLEVNGEAIYGTRKWEDAPEVDADTKVFFTQKDGNLYVIMTEWPDTPVTVKGAGSVRNVSLLGSDKKVSFSKSGKDLVIKPVRLGSVNEIPCNYAWVFKVERQTR